MFVMPVARAAGDPTFGAIRYFGAIYWWSILGPLCAFKRLASLPRRPTIVLVGTVVTNLAGNVDMVASFAVRSLSLRYRWRRPLLLGWTLTFVLH